MPPPYREEIRRRYRAAKKTGRPVGRRPLLRRLATAVMGAMLAANAYAQHEEARPSAGVPGAGSARPAMDADAPAGPGMQPPGATDAAGAWTDPLYLTVELNGRDTGVIIRATLNGGQLLARARDLEAVGLDLSHQGQAGDTLLALDSIPDLQYRYDAGRQALALQAPNDLLQPFVYGRPAAVPAAGATSGRGVVLNYDAYYQYERQATLSLWNELRYFSPLGVFENSGAAYMGHRRDDYVRFDTSWTHSDPDAMRTLRLGDTISSSLDWIRPVRMAGIQISRNFDLRPDLVTFPVPLVTGSAAVPSTVDLYINNIHRSSVDVPQGPFIFNDAPGITGAGTATIVTRDALGRAVSSTLPLYVDRRMLAEGLTGYSVEAGFLRRNYGYDSFEYDHDPAGSATVRHGYSDSLTLEGQAQAMPGAFNAGGGALLRLGSRGVLNVGVSASGGAGSGTRMTLGYQWIQPRFSIDLQTTRSFGDYWDLGGTDGYPAPHSLDRATLSVPFGDTQSVALSYIGYETEGYAPSRIGSVAYTASLGKRASVNVSAFQDFGPQRDKGVFLSLNISLESGTHLGAYGGRQNGETSYNASAMRSPDYDGGWGWGVQAGRTAHMRWGQAQTTYRGRYGEVTALAQNFDGRDGFALNASGGMVLMDGGLALSRRIHDSFALVSTNGIEEVPVRHENRLIGRTDGKGHYLIPDLNAYQSNQVSIDGLHLPARMKLTDNSRTVVPQWRSGVLVEFPITEYRAATVLLHRADGRPVAVGAQVLHEESGALTVVGHDGMAFVEGLRSENRLRVAEGDETCAVQFAYDDDARDALPTIGPLTCETQRQ